MPRVQLRTIAIKILMFYLNIGLIQRVNSDILNTYEFGAHVDDEELALNMDGRIALFEPHYSINLTHRKPYLQQRYTYILVEYTNPVSKVKIAYDPETLMLTFHVKYPFAETPFAVKGFALPIFRRTLVVYK